VNLVLNVLAGGIDTTAAQLAHALRLFAAHPEQWEVLRQRPDLVSAAVDEVLRFEPITPFTARLCTEEIEHRGVIFPAGTIVAICAERANRETAAGEVFDITADRIGERALTFGAGAHFCLGQNLARAELEEALGFLAPRLPGLRPDGTERLGGVEGIYGIESLPLAWSAA
jgi:cytochrome P450